MTPEEQKIDGDFIAPTSIKLKGKTVEFQDEGTGIIADETEDSIYIVSNFFTGWMFKAEYFDLLGIPD